LWILDIYGFMLAGFLITMGTLGDLIGRRRLLLIGAAAFGVATVAAAYATTAEALVATRAAMGIAGATLMPSTLALISTMFTDARQRGTAIAVWFSCLMAGGALGPVAGGVLLERFWWGSVFLMGAPLMAALLVLGPSLLPEYRDPRGGRLDVPSAGLSLGATLPVVYGLKELATGGNVTASLVAVTVGAVFAALFVRRQRRIPTPLVDLHLFRNRIFGVSLVILTVGSVTMGGTYLLVNLYLQEVASLSPLRAGLWMLLPATAVVVASMLAPRLARRIRPGSVIAGGLALTAAGYLLLTQVDGAGGLPLLLVGLVLAFLGSGPMGALGTDLVVGSAPPSRAGSAASMSETSNNFGIALGIAGLGSVGALVYRRQLMVPAEVPLDQAEASRESVTAASAVADVLPDGQADQLLGSALGAFTSGLNVAAALGVVLFTTSAVLAGVVYRPLPRHATIRARPSVEGEPGPSRELVPATGSR
jgi:DHA2 family multidrug resistance protein-like MFS transporter